MNSRNYVIIGGSRGIGGAIVSNLAKGGASVRYSSRSGRSPDGSQDERAFAFDAALEEFPKNVIPVPLDGLVYCPGTINLKPFQRLKLVDFQADLQTNLLGAVTAIKACLPAMKKNSKSTSIVLFSTVAVQTGMPFHASIASAKGAIEGLTRSLAAEFAPRIRVNAVAPSLTDTTLAADLLSSDQKRQASADRHPLKRIGDPDEIAKLALFLLGDEARWITGQIFHADGGIGALRTFK